MNAPLPVVTTGIHCLDFMPLDELIEALESNTYPGASKQSIKLVVANCRAQLLDPLTKPFHIVPMKVKQVRKDSQGKELAGKFDYKWRDVIMPGIELYRIKAARTGEYVGIADAKWGPEITEELGGEAKEEWDEAAGEYADKGKKWEKLSFKFREWCEITVYRFVKGEPRAFSSGRVYFKETYATASADTSLPNTMWRKRTHGQHEKCAEALALRRAFPEVGGAPTREEMEGKVLEHTAIEGTVTGKTLEPVPPIMQTESSSPAAGASSSPGASPNTGGAATDQKPANDVPLTEGEKAHIRQKLTAGALSELDLKNKFGCAIDELKASQFPAVKNWIRNPAGQ